MSNLLEQIIRHYVRSLLSELKIVDLSEEENSYMIFAYRGWLFKFPGYDTDDIPWDDIERKTGIDLEEIKKDIFEEGTSTDYFVGHVDEGILSIPAKGSFQHSAISSNLVKKIVKDLNIRHIRGAMSFDEEDEDIEPEYGSNESLGTLPDIFYHGTNSNSLFGQKAILKIGLVPGEFVGKSNWKDQGIWHDKVVSLTVEPQLTYFHAKNASKQHGGFPVVLIIRVPDKDRIVADYDVDFESGGLSAVHDTVRNVSKNTSSKSPGRIGKGGLKTSIDVGTVGYLGRIPSTFIKGFLYWSNQDKGWKRADLLELQQMQYVYENYDEEYYEMDIEDDFIERVQDEIDQWNYFSADYDFKSMEDVTIDYSTQFAFDDLSLEDIELTQEKQAEIAELLPGDNFQIKLLGGTKIKIVGTYNGDMNDVIVIVDTLSDLDNNFNSFKEDIGYILVEEE